MFDAGLRVKSSIFQSVVCDAVTKSVSMLALISAIFLLSSPAAAQENRTTYQYDGLGRLVTETRPDEGGETTFTYDALGNRLTAVETSTAGIFNVSNADALEGGVLTFTVTREGGDANSYDIVYSTSHDTTEGGDYTSVSNSTVTFAPGELSKPITIQTSPDSVFEGPEQFFLNISSPNGGIIADGVGVGTINDNSPAPVFSIGDDTKTEGSDLTFTVTKSGSTALTHTVNYATANGSATAGSDYVADSAGMLSFAPGEPSKTITITGLQDGAVEGVEDFYVNLVSASNGALIDDTQDQGVGTINDDDTVSPDDIVLTLVDPATQLDVKVLSATDTIDLSELSTTDYALRVDYQGTSSVGSVRFFENGVLVKNENIAPYSRFGDGIPNSSDLYGDPLPASAFTLKVEVWTANNGGGSLLEEKTYSIGIGVAPPFFTISDQIVQEDAGTADFTVTLTDATTLTHTVDYATADNTALSGSDYTTTSGTLTFIPGNPTTQTISVPITNDTVVEGEETFHVNLTNATGGNAVITDSLGIGTITDDDVATNDITLTLVDGVTQTHLRVLSLTDTISASEFSNNRYALRVDYQGTASVGSVLFIENSVLARTENAAPYSRFGDRNGGADLVDGPIPASAFTLKIEVWSGSNGGGTLLEEATYSLGVN